MVYDVIQNLEKFGQHIFQNLKSTNQKLFFQFLTKIYYKTFFWLPILLFFVISFPDIEFQRGTLRVVSLRR